MLRENAPDASGVFERRRSYTQLLKGDILAVEHAVDVVVGHHEQLSRISKGFVFREPKGQSDRGLIIGKLRMLS